MATLTEFTPSLSALKRSLTHVYHIAYAPAIKKAYLFHWGCNLKCKGCLCHKEINCMALEENLDVVFRDPRLRPPQTPAGSLSFDELITILEKVELAEVAFEGQEASLDPTLPEICRYLKGRNARVVLHTNGVAKADTANIDEVIVSLKAVTPRIYQEYTGLSNSFVLENFKRYHDSSVLLKAESVFIPGYIGFDETEKIARFISSVDKSIPYRIDAYFESGDNPWRAPEPAEMKEAVGIAKQHLANVYSTQQTKRELTKADLLYEVIRLY
ncbi:Pyruvate-formate lyase-activating enzyme [Dehalogenimonas formicexedens]|uniref:Pyruvate-formate lyase-activating enzyme n=2 Tax=Dehalogenimonas TaxID=670486 RepID=A0A1P8FA31_9CHLR|nr:MULTISPECIES: radical SAM protein [Dehalogenimonas]APV45303.1 Pyruvate-formate lyase-activating enzyme [Dehalogenimonas formicexedens]KTB49108.1 Pyruvate-formate lyase-activating enzyme [Dehalogenimonas alkenigignens]